MKISDIKNFYVEDIYNNHKEIRVSSLKKACEIAIERAETTTLIHIGSFNLDRYHIGDTYETLYQRCADIIKECDGKFGAWF